MSKKATVAGSDAKALESVANDSNQSTTTTTVKTDATGTTGNDSGTEDSGALFGDSAGGAVGAGTADLTLRASAEANAGVPARDPAPEVIVASQPAYPREVELVNETGREYCIGLVHLLPSTRAKKVLMNADELVRLQSDCTQLLSLSPSLQAQEPKPLRIEAVNTAI